MRRFEANRGESKRFQVLSRIEAFFDGWPIVLRLMEVCRGAVRPVVGSRGVLWLEPRRGESRRVESILGFWRRIDREPL